MDDKKIIFSMVNVSKTIPPQRQILKNIYLSFFYGAKIGVLGLNGAGKSTLLKIIAGLDKSFQGEVVFSPGYSVGYLEQEPQLDDTKTVREVVQEAVQETVDLLREYDEVNNAFAEPDADFDKLIERQGELTELLEAHDAWNLDQRLDRAMDALRCPDDDQMVKNLSGGERRRVALCRLLLQEPDPRKALDNYREMLTRINSREVYDELLHSGFPVLLRDENRCPEETMALAEQILNL